MNKAVMHDISYGLYILSAREGEKDNGCVVNTVQQAASAPNILSVAVNKQNYTHDMILRTRALTVSILDETAPFELYKSFGFQSGRDADKFAGYEAVRGENGILYLARHTCGYIGGKVINTVNLGSHTLFLAAVTEAEALSDSRPVTYEFYHANVKPKPEETKTAAKGWRCKVCGYVYEGETLPADFVCPWCKHGVEDFEPIG